MEIYITTRHMDLTDDVYDYTRKKLTKAEHYYNGITEAHVIIETVKYHTYTVEVSLMGRHVTFHAQAHGETVFAAVDSVVDKIDKQVRRYKERIKNNKHKPPRREVVDTIVDAIKTEEEDSAPDDTDRVVPTNEKFAPKPMSIDEAADQFRINNDDLLVFINAETDSVNVLYRMKNGKIGWVAPEFD